MLAPGNAEGETLIMGAVERAGDTDRLDRPRRDALGLSKIDFEGSDSLDNPNAVFQ
jgi:putative iron-regulated protein